jgi:2-keto-4-pentenoate hydratase
VLDSYLLALRQLVELLVNDSDKPPLRAGEVISTGRLTFAMPVSPSENSAANISDTSGGFDLYCVRHQRF